MVVESPAGEANFIIASNAPEELAWDEGSVLLEAQCRHGHVLIAAVYPLALAGVAGEGVHVLRLAWEYPDLQVYTHHVQKNIGYSIALKGVGAGDK